ncbi:MAG: CRISPR-associated endonuclease Cas2 [Methanomassiliicoccales archaeon]
MRNLYIISYDIRDQKRWRKVFNIAKGYGVHLQYSVFYCYLSPKEKVLLISDIEGVIDHKSDRVLIANIGGPDVNIEQKVEFLGQKNDISPHQAVII